MNRKLIPLLVAGALLATVPGLAPVQAAPQADAGVRVASPSKMVLDNSERILSTLESRRAEFNSNPAALRQFVSSEFNNMFDRDYAARQVLGRHGRGASDADIKAFGDALADNLMQRYGSSLLNFNTRLQVRVKSETPLPRGLGVKVSSEMMRSDGDAIPVDYLMRQSGGQWKVFDVLVEGVSFVQTFRQQFDQELQNKSISQVAAELRKGQLNANADK
ncbi:MlaC/ttg2D family ABC transporter substrate-binding protein [Luteimonas lutimaris]|uniref:ABC transporter substrate-binding protein n=1 Tax=Luteimonas lutimaris TaxID=698645 RepID=A0ABP7M1A0_9GAMM